MRLDKRGDLGFPEAIMAVMIITLSLTAFMGVVAFDLVNNDDDRSIELDPKIFERLSLDAGTVVGDLNDELNSMVDRHGYKGISVTCKIPGELGFESAVFSVGDLAGDPVFDRFLCSMNSSDGRVLPAVIEVMICV